MIWCSYDSSGRHGCKVTLFICFLYGGGVERVCVALVNLLKHNGLDLELFVLNFKNALLQDDFSRVIGITDMKVN